MSEVITAAIAFIAGVVTTLVGRWAEVVFARRRQLDDLELEAGQSLVQIKRRVNELDPASLERSIDRLTNDQLREVAHGLWELMVPLEQLQMLSPRPEIRQAAMMAVEHIDGARISALNYLGFVEDPDHEPDWETDVASRLDVEYDVEEAEHYIETLAGTLRGSSDVEREPLRMRLRARWARIRRRWRG